MHGTLEPVAPMLREKPKFTGDPSCGTWELIYIYEQWLWLR